MIIYNIVCVMILILFVILYSKISTDKLFPQLLFFLFTIIGSLSVLYLENFPIYIFEQDKTSYFNGSALILTLMLLLHAIGAYLANLVFKREVMTRQLNARVLGLDLNFLFSVLFPLILLTLCYINIAISGEIPIFSSGYIDRFEYIVATKLWFLLSAFGVTTSIIPISFGFAFAHYRPFRGFIALLFLLYLVYIVFIGHKFGGLIWAMFFFSLPYVVIYFKGNLFVVLKKYFLALTLFVAAVFGLILYHYSQYSFAQDFGGPVAFLFYRIFGLTGHSFWGGVNEFIGSLSTHSMDKLMLYWNGMDNLMLSLGRDGIESAIERGVQWTFAYFGVSLMYLKWFALPIFVLNGYLFTLVCYLVSKEARRKDFLSYFILINILNWYSIYLSSGSLSDLISLKVVLFLILYLFWIEIQSVYKKSSHRQH